MSSGEKRPLAEAKQIAVELARILSPACEELYIAGSIRRGKAEVGDCELVAIPAFYSAQSATDEKPENALWWLLDALVEEGTIAKALLGKTKKQRWGKKYRALVFRGMQFDLFTADTDNLGYLYWLRTGPADGNKWLVTFLKFNADFSIEDGYVWHQGKKLHIPTESDWWALLGHEPLSPGQRTEAAYKSGFKSHHRFGNPALFHTAQEERAVKSQMAMVLNVAFDEVKLIEHTKVNADASPLPAAFRWEFPWQPMQGFVWVYDGWEYGRRTYALVSQSDPRAVVQAHILRCSVSLYAETCALRQWLEERAGTRKHPYPTQDISDLSIEYFMGYDEGSMQVVPWERIRFQQEEYRVSVARQYWRSGALRNDAGQLPHGLMFDGSDVVHLVDGTHRAIAWRWAGRDGLPMQVVCHAESLEDALMERERIVRNGRSFTSREAQYSALAAQET